MLSSEVSNSVTRKPIMYVFKLWLCNLPMTQQAAGHDTSPFTTRWRDIEKCPYSEYHTISCWCHHCYIMSPSEWPTHNNVIMCHSEWPYISSSCDSVNDNQVYNTSTALCMCMYMCVCVWGLPCSPFSYMYTCTVGVKQCLHVYRFVCWQKIFKNASGKLARVCRGFIVDANNERTLLGMFMYTWYKSRQFFAIIFSCFLLSVHRLHPFWNCTW